MRPLQAYRNQAFSPMTAYLPVVRREGSRPLLAALRQRQPIGQPALHRNFIAVSPPASPSYKCARTARTPYLLFLIYYLLFNLPRRGNLRLYFGALCSGLSRALKTPHRGVFAPRYAERGVSTCGYRIELRPLTWLVLCDRCACSGFLFPPQAAVTSAASCSRPRWCTLHCFSMTHKIKNTPQLLARCLLWCTIGDSNPGPTD